MYIIGSSEQAFELGATGGQSGDRTSVRVVPLPPIHWHVVIRFTKIFYSIYICPHTKLWHKRASPQSKRAWVFLFWNKKVVLP